MLNVTCKELLLVGNKQTHPGTSTLIQSKVQVHLEVQHASTLK